jgi:CBS domain-containing protein
MQNTLVRDIMTENPIVISPDETLQEAAQKMKEYDCGFLPVGSRDKVVGAITDRDIVVRVVAEGGDASKIKVGDAMTNLVCACRPDDTLADAAAKMRDDAVSRLVVVDDGNKIKGVLSFGHILRKHADREEINEVVGCLTGRNIPDAGIAGSVI